VKVQIRNLVGGVERRESNAFSKLLLSQLRNLEGTKMVYRKLGLNRESLKVFVLKRID
jgi:hypothetical protein